MRIFPVLVAALMGAGPPVSAQQATPTPPAPTLRLFVLQGNNAVIDITGRTHTASTPIVEVRDLNDQPVEGADVIFELPASGPGGSFPGNKITFQAKTNTQGQASGPFTPNSLPGRFFIHVTATSGERFGRVTIQQTSATLAATGTGDKTIQHSSRKKWIIIASVGAAAAVAVGVVLATRGSGSTPASTPTTTTPTIIISAGPPVFGGH